MALLYRFNNNLSKNITLERGGSNGHPVFYAGLNKKFEQKTRSSSRKKQQTTVRFKLPVQGPGPGKNRLQFIPEFLSMIFHFCVHQLVNNNEIPQLIRQVTDLDIKADIVGRRTAAPPGSLPANRYPVKVEMIFFSQAMYAGNQRFPASRGEIGSACRNRVRHFFSISVVRARCFSIHLFLEVTDCSAFINGIPAGTTTRTPWKGMTEMLRRLARGLEQK